MRNWLSFCFICMHSRVSIRVSRPTEALLSSNLVVGRSLVLSMWIISLFLQVMLKYFNQSTGIGLLNWLFRPAIYLLQLTNKLLFRQANLIVNQVICNKLIQVSWRTICFHLTSTWLWNCLKFHLGKKLIHPFKLKGWAKS